MFIPIIPPITLLIISIKKYSKLFNVGKLLNIKDNNRSIKVITIPINNPLMKPFFSLILPVLNPLIKNNKIINIKDNTETTLYEIILK